MNRRMGGWGWVDRRARERISRTGNETKEWLEKQARRATNSCRGCGEDWLRGLRTLGRVQESEKGLGIPHTQEEGDRHGRQRLIELSQSPVAAAPHSTDGPGSGRGESSLPTGSHAHLHPESVSRSVGSNSLQPHRL